MIICCYFASQPRYTTLKQLTKMHQPRFKSKLPDCPSVETVEKLFKIAEGFIQQAETLVGNVVEIDGKLADALEREVLLVTGDKAKIIPKILTPSLMFRELEIEKGIGSDSDKVHDPLDDPDSLNGYEINKLFPQIPSSRLSLDFCGILYNALMVLKRAGDFRKEPAKLKSNALFLSGLRSVLRDLNRLKSQRDSLDHLIYQSQDQLSIMNLEPQIMAEQLSILDSSLYCHMQVIEELSFASWIGKERRQRAPFLTAMREFGGYISRWVTWEIVKPGLSIQERAQLLIHFIQIGECLAEMASYNQLFALIRGLSSPSILRLGPLFDVLPKRTLMSWDTLQGLIQEPIKQRALLSKAPATCIPAVDTAFLLDLLSIEPGLLGIKVKAPENVKHKFLKYCESIEKFRLQSSRVYNFKFSLHPAIQHFILSRPFYSAKELETLSHFILKPEDSNVLAPESCLIKTIHRRYLDDDDRLFFPLQYQSSDLDGVEEQEVVVEEEVFSLGEQPEDLVIKSIYQMDDIDERAARINSV